MKWILGVTFLVLTACNRPLPPNERVPPKWENPSDSGQAWCGNGEFISKESAMWCVEASAPKDFTRRELQVVGANAYLCGQLDELATVASLDTTRDTWMAGAAKRANCDKIHELIDGRIK